MKTRNIIAEDEAGVIANLKTEIERCCKQALSSNGTFRVGLSGKVGFVVVLQAKANL